MNDKIKLVLEDGSIFEGYSFGFEKSVSGEVVFNTGMVGYPESLTDPSYYGQILVLTYPLVGNYGITKEVEGIGNFESDRIQISGLIVSDYSKEHDHWSSVKSLGEWLSEFKIPGIYGIDTRKLTKILREKGTMLGKIIFANDVDFFDVNKVNLVEKVSCKEIVNYGSGKKKIILIDCGVKNNIIRNLVERGLEVVRVPWDYDFLDMDFDGVFISNGPGDPKLCEKTVENVKKVFELGKPVFGICLGNQILSLAAGADTYKLKFGHRSQNQPCLEVGSKKCFVTSQNHGYAVDSKTLPKDWEEWFVNINDGSNEGIKHKSKPFMAFQGHPEHHPGPVDTNFIFDLFVERLNGGK